MQAFLKITNFKKIKVLYKNFKKRLLTKHKSYNLLSLILGKMSCIFPERFFLRTNLTSWFRETCFLKKKLDFAENIVSLLTRLSMEVEKSTHVPILVDAILEAFQSTAGKKFLDGTLGGAGHTKAILEKFPQCEIYGLDRDPIALERARATLDLQRIHLFHQNFCDLDKIGENDFDGILLDLGVSSDQLDHAERGFSFQQDAPLDMRMDFTRGQTAAEFLETAPREDLIKALRDYGEELHWKRVLGVILDSRGTGKLQRTTSFADLVRRALPHNFRTKINPATKTFQGIRIAVNGELTALEAALPKAFNALKVGGVLAVLTFHSLEDRIVKQHMRNWSGLAIHRLDSRCQDERECFGELLTAKPITASEEEIARNPRSRSAKLRLFRKTKAMVISHETPNNRKENPCGVTLV